MKFNKNYLLILIIMLLVLINCEPALAAPGGKIVYYAVKTWWGKAFMVLCFVIFLPFIIRYYYLEKKAIKQASGTLTQLAKLNPAFRWSLINERAHAVVTQVYSAWSKADMEKATEWMTSWYWQNQKLTVLEGWEDDGLTNFCRLNNINSIKPLFVEYYEEEQGDGEGSRISLLVAVNLVDYLVDKKTGDIVVGDKENKDYDSIWTLVLEKGHWKLSLIEDSAMTLDYAKMQNELGMAVEHIKSGYRFKQV